MKWTHVKTLLILLLVAVNIFLAVNLFLEYRAHSSIDIETFDSIINILKKHGITFDKSITGEYRQIGAVKINNIGGEINAIAEKLFGEYEFKAERNSKLYSVGESYLSYNSSYYFEYYNENVKSKLAGENAAYDVVKKFFANIGIPDTYYMLNKPVIDEENGYLSLYARQLVDGIPVFGNELRFIIYENGISEISGKWFFGTVSYLQVNEKDMVNMLFAVERFYFSQFKDEPVTVLSVEQGYSMLYSAIDNNLESVVIASAWNILTDKHNIIYSSVMGQFVSVEEISGDLSPVDLE